MFKRSLFDDISHVIASQRSVLLFGPRQVGKTTLSRKIRHDRYINLMDPNLRLSYERHPGLLIHEVKADSSDKLPLIIIDEVQKVPEIMDSVQVLIDENLAQFIIIGSSARQIRNLLPGRVIRFQMTPLSLTEYLPDDLNAILSNGSLPGLLTFTGQDIIDQELGSYVSTYLEEEVRKEALVRNLSAFSLFLQLVCVESGNLISFRKLSQQIGVAHTTISEYYNILEDCMIAERFEPITSSHTRKRLTKASKYIIFDLGIRRLGAKENVPSNVEHWSRLFEQFIGLELRRQKHMNMQIKFWRDHSGPEVDWVLVQGAQMVPIEVKWTERPNEKDARHLKTFMKEYDSERGVIVCRCNRKLEITDNIVALPWQELSSVFSFID